MSNINKSIKERVFSHFDSVAANALIEYSKKIASVETDIIICMARKAARLHDLLILAGCPTPAQAMMFHHVLDQDLARFKGKTITLVDDTLFSGTTLRRAIDVLKGAGAKSVATIVFALDKDFKQWQQVQPEHCFLELDHDSLLGFCNAEVQALAAFSIPYLSDFPVSEIIHLSSSKFNRMQNPVDWDIFSVNQFPDTSIGTSVFTILPPEDFISLLAGIFGDATANIVSICKVRAFVRKQKNSGYFARIVPLVTFTPLKENSINQLFENILSTTEKNAATKFDLIRQTHQSARSKLRFSQYAISSIIGYYYLEDLKTNVSLNRIPELDLVEATRLFGPWLGTDLKHFHSTLKLMVSRDEQNPSTNTEFQPAQIPKKTLKMFREECENSVGEIPKNGSQLSEIRSVRTDLERVFLNLYEDHEIPAREEVKNGVSNEDARHRNRLRMGYDWDTLAMVVLAREGVKATKKRKQILSLLLDTLVDAGIAVPILCNRDGVFFRAYRHGEDVLFSNHEFALSHDVMDGFLKGSGRESIPRLVFEKLLVSLVKVGVSKKFLTVIHGLNGENDRLVRVGYHLHGAVLNRPLGESPYADNQSTWLSQYMLERGIFHTNANKQYVLGTRPSTSLNPPDAKMHAQHLGLLIGKVFQLRDSSGQELLSENDLAVLATCTQPKDVSLAISAEIRSIYTGTILAAPLTISNDRNDAKIQYKEFVGSDECAALHSALMKLVSYDKDKLPNIINRCGSYLGDCENGMIMESQWNATWEPILATQDVEQKTKFDIWINRCGRELSMAALSIFSMELALASQAYGTGANTDRTAFTNVCKKILKYINSLQEYNKPSEILKRLSERCENDQPILNFQEAYSYGHNRLQKRKLKAIGLVRNVSTVATNYGRTDKRTNFPYVVWYDIIDSLGQKSKMRGEPLSEYRARIKQFKQRINTELKMLIHEVNENTQVDIFCSNSTVDSENDEKNIFFSGKGLREVQQTIDIILEQANVSNINVRVIASSTDYAGNQAHKFELDSFIKGEGFWEHGSRFRGQIKTLETSPKQECNYLWLAGKLTKNPLCRAQVEHLVRDCKHNELITDIENYALAVDYFGGAVYN